MAQQSNLPHVTFETVNGMVKQVCLDGVPLKGVRGVSFTADAQGGYPTVTIQLWANVTLTGEMESVIQQDRHVRRCTRAHAEELGTDRVRTVPAAPEPSTGHFRGTVHTSRPLRDPKRGSVSSLVPDGYPDDPQEGT